MSVDLSPDQMKRHVRASRKSLRDDTAFFRANPTRFWRARPSVPFEDGRYPDAAFYEKYNFALVWRGMDGYRQTMLIAANPKAPLPDDDVFLGSVWLRAKCSGTDAEPVVNISQLEHLGLIYLSKGVNEAARMPRVFP